MTMNEQNTEGASGKLLPCPFCKGAAHMAREHDPDDIAWAFVRCRGCGVRTRGKWYSRGNDCPQLYEEVRDEWNRRATEGASGDGVPVVQAPSRPGLACAFDCKWPEKCCKHGNYTHGVPEGAK